jgi:Bacterial TSP3 repeat
MKNILKIVIFSVIYMLVVGNIPIAFAQIDVTNIEVFDIEDQRARIKWSTYGVPTKGIVYYGLDYQQLDKFIGYGSYSYSHESVMSGLEKDTTYYYKIKVIDNLDESYETYVGSFSTDDMTDTIRPDILEVDVLQTTQDRAAIYWRVDEEVKSYVYYGLNRDDLDKYKRVSRWSTEYELELTRLLPYSKYYVQVVVEDKSGNEKASSIHIFNTDIGLTKDTSLLITDVQPLGQNEHLVFADQALIKWETNMLANSRVYYGTEPNKLRKSIKIITKPRSLEHRVVIDNLESSTIYYYMIKSFDSFYNKKDETPVFSFETTGLSFVAEVPIDSPVDADGDGLYDDYEIEIGTDPLIRDTDGDGYSDGLEVSYGYNPRGSGRLINNIFAYSKSRVGHDIESGHAQYLRTELENRMNNLNIGVKHWYKLLNAYIYGDYPIEAIAQAIRFGGKTVHPTMPWSIWQNSDDYKEYIDKD